MAVTAVLYANPEDSTIRPGWFHASLYRLTEYTGHETVRDERIPRGRPIVVITDSDFQEEEPDDEGFEG